MCCVLRVVSVSVFITGILIPFGENQLYWLFSVCFGLPRQHVERWAVMDMRRELKGLTWGVG